MKKSSSSSNSIKPTTGRVDNFFVHKNTKVNTSNDNNQKSKFQSVNRYKKNVPLCNKKLLANEETLAGKRSKKSVNKGQQGAGITVARRNKKKIAGESMSQADKVPFDKKQWRYKKYSKKFKLEQELAKRKSSMLRQYQKEVKDVVSNKKIKDIYEEDSDTAGAAGQTSGNSRNSNEDCDITHKHKAIPDKAIKFNGKSKQQITKQNVSNLLTEQEKNELQKLQKKENKERLKTHNKKTKKGQPVMKDRIEMLLRKIQSD